VIFWKCLLELETGQKKKASISLRQLESLALGRETDLYTANLLDQSLKQARKALLKSKYKILGRNALNADPQESQCYKHQ